jgi:hypothetical protein
MTKKESIPIIEPSEIFTEREDPRGEVNPSSLSLAPWVRLLARLFDYSLFFTLLHLIAFRVDLNTYGWIPIEFFAWIPIETLLLWTWGTTPGKWLLKIELRKKNARRIPFEPALRRSFMVWFRGIGMGIAFVNILCMLSAYYRLKKTYITSWDRDEKFVVSCQELPHWRFYLAIGFVILGLIFYSY